MEMFIRPSSWRRPRGYRRGASALVCAALVSAGLATGAAARPQTGSPATAPGAGAAAARDPAARVGLRPIKQRALQAIVRKTASELHVPGALVLLRTPQGRFTAAYGTTQLGSRIRPQPDTYFRIASITKTMTSAVILQLAQEGKLRLSDPVSKYVAGVPNGNQITIAMLLKMRSGLFDYTSSPEIAPFFDNDPTKVWTPQELLTISFAQPPNFAPDTDYEYSNTNYALLGLIVQRWTTGRWPRRCRNGCSGLSASSTRCSPRVPRTGFPSRSRTATCTGAPPP